MEKKTWARGKKKLTPEQKQEAYEKNKVRMKIANLVARKPEIENKCCICGKKGQVLHNQENPYFITFICWDCRKDPEKLKEAEKHRFDLKSKLNKENLNVSNFTTQEVLQMVNGYMKKDLFISLGDYCNQIGVSRYQFNKLIKRYMELLPNSNIEELIKNKAAKLKEIQLLKMLEDRKIRNLL